MSCSTKTNLVYLRVELRLGRHTKMLRVRHTKMLLMLRIDGTKTHRTYLGLA